MFTVAVQEAVPKDAVAVTVAVQISVPSHEAVMVSSATVKLSSPEKVKVALGVSAPLAKLPVTSMSAVEPAEMYMTLGLMSQASGGVSVVASLQMGKPSSYTHTSPG